MLCTNCGENPARLYVKKTADGETDLWLCPDCYSALYCGSEDDLLASMLKEDGGKKTCPNCGTTLDDFRRTNLLGCAYCYTAFRTELTPTIRAIQGKLHHVGKVPAEIDAEKYDTLRRLVYEQEAVREQLQEAERTGDNERARHLRLRLEELGRRISGGEE